MKFNADVLYIILNFLSQEPKFILNCRLICKDWNNLITNSQSLWNELKFSGSNLKFIPQKFSSKLRNLKCNNISNEELKKFITQFPNLQHLDLSYCFRLSSAGFKSLSNLTSLQELILTECRNFYDTDLKSISNLSSLKVLDLSWCEKITDFGV